VIAKGTQLVCVDTVLGFEKVRNYDGSWIEWGNVVGQPIEKP
jgi:3-mercaptopyruvate sulfurtransferase SseA